MDQKKTQSELKQRVENRHKNTERIRNNQKNMDKIYQKKFLSDFSRIFKNKKTGKSGDNFIRANLSKKDILQLEKESKGKVLAIEEHIPPETDMNEALAATGMAPFVNGGNNIGVYLSEGGCPNADHINQYTRLDTSNTNNHVENTSAIIRIGSQNAHIYCSGGFHHATAAELNGVGNNPRIHIESHSWSNYQTNIFGQRIADPDYRILDRNFDNHVYNNGIFIVKSAGNNAPTVGTPGKGLNVLTVGNYNDATFSIANTSNGDDPETGNIKPEVSAPGTNIAAGGHTLSGTSMSTPFVAAMAANLMGSPFLGTLQLRPHLMKALILAGAKQNITGNNGRIGIGGANYRDSLVAKNALMWWDGSNNDFATFDGADIIPNNGRIDAKFYVKSRYTKTRVVISWLNRGNYTFANRAANHPIGTDLNIDVYDPSGNYIGGSSSMDNSFEYVDFNPTRTGNYRVSISRAFNRDTASNLRIGLAVMSSN